MINVDFANDRELVVGSFKTIRAFRGPVLDVGYYSLNGHGPWKIGETYEATCIRSPAPKPWVASTSMIKKYGMGSELWCPPLKHRHQRFQVSFSKAPFIEAISDAEAAIYIAEEEKLNRPDEPTEHRAPVGDCTCGFYSFYSDTVIQNDGAKYISHNSMYAVVENTGVVIHGSMGIRSQKMKIVGVVGETHQSLAELLEDFPLDVYQ
jgi:hypothetical protein